MVQLCGFKISFFFKKKKLFLHLVCRNLENCCAFVLMKQSALCSLFLSVSVPARTVSGRCRPRGGSRSSLKLQCTRGTCTRLMVPSQNQFCSTNKLSQKKFFSTADWASCQKTVFSCIFTQFLQVGVHISWRLLEIAFRFTQSRWYISHIGIEILSTALLCGFLY